MKTCSRCEEEKPYEDFKTHHHTADGYDAWCMECHREYSRSYRRKKVLTREQEVEARDEPPLTPDEREAVQRAVERVYEFRNTPNDHHSERREEPMEPISALWRKGGISEVRMYHLCDIALLRVEGIERQEQAA